MHELSIATAILEQLDAEQSKRPGLRFTKVGLRIGELSGIDPDALSFGLEALTKDTAWEPLAVDIEWIERRQRCTACGHEFKVVDFETACPACGDLRTVTLQGEELDIAYVEAEEVPA